MAREDDRWSIDRVAFGLIGADESAWLSNDLLFSLMIWAILCLAIEPALFSVGLRTPGKSLLNISVAAHSTSGHLNLSRAFRRSVGAWTKGLGIGFPIVSLITTLRQYSELKNNGTTSYDAEQELVVSHGQINGLRKALMACFILLIVLLIASDALAN